MIRPFHGGIVPETETEKETISISLGTDEGDGWDDYNDMK